MADHFYGLNIGGSIGDVATGAATTSKSIELRLHDGDGLTKTDVAKALEVLQGYLDTQNAPA